MYHLATMHSITDRQTDRHYHANRHAVRSAKNFRPWL